MSDEARECFCPVSRTLQIINKKWNIEIITDLFFGKKRFKEFKERNPNLSNKVLAECLKNLENNGVIERRVVNSSPVSTEYYLTPRGTALNRIIYELAIFSLEDDDFTDKNTRLKLKKDFKETLRIDL